MSREKGQAVVEAALVLPVILVMLMAVLSFGLLFTVELVVMNASREGARLGSIGKTAPEIRDRIDDYLENARLTPARAEVAIAGAAGPSGSDVTITIGYPVELIIPVPGLPNPAKVTSQATMRIE